VSLTYLMVRILTDDYHFHIIEWAEIEGVENVFARRKTLELCVLAFYKVGKVNEVLLLKLVA
jgi:hypothetical protein